ALWQDPGYPRRQHVEACLPVVTGYSAPMVKHGLDTLLAGFRADALWTLLRAELGDPRVLDAFRPRRDAGGLSRAFGPRLISHVFSGNVPGLPAWSLICALLTKSASLGKVASEEPLFAVHFARSLAEVCAELGECLAIAWWKGGEQSLEDVAFSAADAVIAYGSDTATARIRERVPADTRFLAYGHRLSFAFVAREALGRERAPDLAAQLAYAVSVYDQQGCVSPHLVYVEDGGELDAAAFAELLAEQMAQLQTRFPRGAIPLEESSAIRHLRGEYEFRELAGEPVRVYASPAGTSWTVLYEADETFTASCLNRTVRVHPIASLAELRRRLEQVRAYLQSAGVACPESRLTEVAECFAQAGLCRISSIARMPWPGMAWHHDGRGNLLDLLRWCDVEPDALTAAVNGSDTLQDDPAQAIQGRVR
ncbi:MAG: acyl-CoA reductase, partial [Gammaproteobacteria bacterium]|nr:acyl-CoA reductase [Gammaproteobacteria bacterium]